MAFFGLKRPQKGLRATFCFWEHPKMFSASDDKKSPMGPIESWGGVRPRRLSSPSNGYIWLVFNILISSNIIFLVM